MKQTKPTTCTPVLPAALPAVLGAWYQTHARVLPWRENADPYCVWLSEIMLQQTRVEAVIGYYTRFLAAFPTVESLALAEEAAVFKLWEGLGYYTRARNLLKTARIIKETYGGQFPADPAALRALPGIGDYTAGAVLSIAFGIPAPAVDGNVLRVLARYLAYAESVSEPRTKQAFAAALAKIYPAASPGLFTQSLMELGATVCVPNGVPHCGVCPLNADCRAHRKGLTADIPVRSAKKARRQEEHTVFIFSCENKTALLKRSETGLLAGMWEYPNCKNHLTAAEAMQQAAAWGCEPVALIKSLNRTHIFTHIEWHMRAYYIRCASTPPCFSWAEKNAVSEHYALPTAFRMFFEND